MSNFKDVYEQGKKGLLMGRTTGVPKIDEAILGIRKKQSIVIAAGPKVGKTTFIDTCFVIAPIMEAWEAYMKGNTTLWDNLHIIYFSLEIDRVTKEFNFATHFFLRMTGKTQVFYKDRVYPVDSNYFQGKVIYIGADGTREPVPVDPEDERILLEVIYPQYISTLFGVYDSKGNQTQAGKITFIEVRENPTGYYKYLMNFAETRGKFTHQTFATKNEQGKTEVTSKITGYVPNNPNEHIMVITDHVRKMKDERNFTRKQLIDKWSEYTTELRNWLWYTFIDVIHTNRGLSNMDRLKTLGEYIYPTGDDVKDSGNLSEEATILITLFNPTDEKYGLQQHFGLPLINYPNYRSVHIVDSRDTPCPQHIQTEFYHGALVVKQIDTNIL